MVTQPLRAGMRGCASRGWWREARSAIPARIARLALLEAVQGNPGGAGDGTLCFGPGGIGGRGVLPVMWPIVREAVDTAVVASLTDVARSVRLLVERARVVAEGAGATPVACALGNHGVRGKIVCVVSGGNIDLKTLLELLSAW